MTEIYVGEVVHYYSKIGVAVVVLVERLAMGDNAHFKSPETHRVRVDFEQEIDSMEVEHRKIPSAESGRMVAIRVNQKVRPGDRVYKKVE